MPYDFTPYDPTPDDLASGGHIAMHNGKTYTTMRDDGILGIWHKPPPAWEDEAFAGTLIPSTRPATPNRILANEMRAEQEATAAQRRTKRERAREQEPEATERAWQAARQQARMQMRQERREERIAAGIEDGPSRVGEMAIALNIDPTSFADFAAACAKVAGRNAAHRGDLFGLASACAPRPQPPAVPERILMQLANDLGVVDAKKAREIYEALVRAGESFADDPPKPRVMEFGHFPAPKSPPPRERYLPGTRHAGRGRH